MKKIAFALLLLVLITSCTTMRTKTYDFATFTMQYPANWKTMLELSPDYEPARDFMWLHVREDFTITSAQQPGAAGLYLTVVTKEHLDLVTFPTWTYATVEEYTRGFNQVPATVGGADGYMYHYDRLWEGQWYEFRDYWFTEGALSYLLSFRAPDLDKYQDQIDLILNSMTFKEWDPFAKN